jgi:hypothetical protein
LETARNDPNLFATLIPPPLTSTAPAEIRSARGVVLGRESDCGQLELIQFWAGAF